LWSWRKEIVEKRKSIYEKKEDPKRRGDAYRLLGTGEVNCKGALILTGAMKLAKVERKTVTKRWLKPVSLFSMISPEESTGARTSVIF
jgi:hypothetical protein